MMTEILLRTENLHKSFGSREVLAGVDFAVSAGTLVGIVGENGSGKSTLLRIVAGELKPGSGQVFHRGAVGYCPQTVVLNEALTVEQHFTFFRAAYNIRDHHRTDELIERLSYGRYRGELVRNLSGGTKQKLNLTLALMHRPELLLLAEPYQGFDWETYLGFWDLVSALKEEGCAALIISHLFFEQARFDLLYRLRQGKLFAQEAAQPRSPASPTGEEA